jgi:DNA-binding transcriptional ArsR family regulator
MAASGRGRARVFGALGDHTRLVLLRKLSAGQPQSIVRLTGGTKLTRQAITKHLGVLERASLVRGVRRGRERLFEFNPEPIREMKQYLDQVSEQCDQA